MKRFAYLLLFIALLFSACSIQVTPAATQTPEVTLTPTPIKLADFTAQMEGVGEHGNMACITYQGDKKDLEGLTFEADIRQGDKVLDSNVPIESINGKDCFEMLDAKYTTGLNVLLKLKISNEKINLENSIQEINLKEFSVVPFLKWIFGENGLDINVFGGFRNNHRGWDLVFSNEIYPNSVGTPIYAISNGRMLTNQIWYPNGENAGHVTNIYAGLDYVGVVWQFGHIDAEFPPIETGRCVSFSTGDLVAKIGKKDAVSSAPHVHFALQTIKDSFRNTLFNHPECSFIDPFSSDPFNDKETNLQYGLWLGEYLPQDVKVLFEKRFFQKHFSATIYEPCLTSSSIRMDSNLDFPCNPK